MQKREAKFQAAFQKWVKENFKKTFVWELKHTRDKDSFPFSEVSPHQINWLLAARHGVISYKIPDIGMVFRPFDGCTWHKVPAYVVIKYPGFFCLIDIDSFLQERDSSIRKSLTSERAKAISYLVIED